MNNLRRLELRIQALAKRKLIAEISLTLVHLVHKPISWIYMYVYIANRHIYIRYTVFGTCGCHVNINTILYESEVDGNLVLYYG